MNVSLNRIVGRNVRLLRKGGGLSQSDLAAAMGWTRQVVSATECGTNNLSLRSLDLLAACLGVSLEQLILEPDGAAEPDGADQPDEAEGAGSVD